MIFLISLININHYIIIKVPTTAIITYVTTRKAGTSSQNGASVKGETLVWIYGNRFASNTFSTSPSSTTSNKVILENQYASYDCELHVDKTTNIQVTCWTP